MSTVALFIGSFAIIIVASELFTNAVEWAGFRLHVASGATGSLLAAIGTALPETVVPIVAVLSRGKTSNDIAIGAVIGAPFLLITVAMGVMGLAVMTRRKRPHLVVDPEQVSRDLGAFLVGFALLVIAFVLPLGLRIVTALALLLLYGAYAAVTLRGSSPNETMPEPLHLVRWREGAPPFAVVVVQLIVSVALLIVGADAFVNALQTTATALNIPALILAVVLVPVGTELPEVINSVNWIRSRDDGLAFGNVAGATTFQVCIPGAFGVAFTSWRADSAALLSAAITIVTGMLCLLALRHGRVSGRALSLALIPWVVYVIVALLFGAPLAYL